MRVWSCQPKIRLSSRFLQALALLLTGGLLLVSGLLPAPAQGSPLGKPGWRFREGSASVGGGTPRQGGHISGVGGPTLTWPLPSTALPPVAGTALPHSADPSTWGTLTLAGRDETGREVQIGGTTLAALPTSARPVLDGLLGADEWGQAQQLVCPFGDGEALVLMAQYDDYHLYLCLAAPSRAGRQGQQAEVYLEVPRHSASQLSSKHLCLTLQATRPGAAARQLTRQGSPRGFAPLPPETPITWRGGAGGQGDGAWGYAVYEFAVPFEYLGARDDSLGLPLGLFVRLVGGGGKSLTAVTPTETIWWPSERSSLPTRLQTPLSLRPDFWGQLEWETTEPGTGLLVPLVDSAPLLDGEIGTAEWVAANHSFYTLPGNQWRLLMIQRDEHNLYLSLVVHLARGSRPGESCTIYLDPCGDGGLRPRPDDLALRLHPEGSGKLTLLRYLHDQWTPSGESVGQGIGVMVSPHESAYELALPLSLFTRSTDSSLLLSTPRLAVEVSYESALR